MYNNCGLQWHTLREDEDEDDKDQPEQSVKNMFTCISHLKFVCMQLLLMSLEDRLN